MWQAEPSQPWQAPQPPPPPPPTVHARLMCYPRAAPVEASHLTSRYMTARDILYVVHSILKPLNAATGGDYYYERLWQANSNKTAGQGLEKQQFKRQEKTKEWSSEHAVLGRVAKTNVARPRSLIAVSPVAADKSTTEDKKHRATLWKARIYCDRAYEAYFAVLDGWNQRKLATTDLMKLLKCLGYYHEAVDGDETTIQPEYMQAIVKLNKGRILLARILEQAILPPKFMQAMLPTIWQVVPTATTDSTDDRFFVALQRVISTLPSLEAEYCVKSLQAVLANHAAVLQSTSRMQAAHALLQRGSGFVAAANNGPLQAEWKEAEDEFLRILSTTQ
jgi:hypothetical protein